MREVKQGKKGSTFVEVNLSDKTLYPGDRDKQTDLQSFVLRIEAPQWNSENDWSHHDMGSETQLRPRIVAVLKGEIYGQTPEDGHDPQQHTDQTGRLTPPSLKN